DSFAWHSRAVTPAPPASPAQKATIVSNFVHVTFGLWFPFLRWTARTLPPVFVARLAKATVERAIWGRAAVREAILDNYAAVLDLPRRSPAVERTGREMVSRHSRLWIDFLRYSSRRDVDPRALLASRSGDERLVAASYEGRGAILLTAHIGNFELGGLFLAQLGLKVAAVYVPDPSPVVEKHREDARRMLGVRGLPIDTSPFAFLPVRKALEENTFVAIQGDRDVSGTGRRMPFFGKTASFPVGPFRLAQASGAPIFPVFVLQEDDGRYRTIVEEAIRVPNARGEEGDAAVVAALALFVASMERTIRAYPSQWYLFTRFWDETS
ncbi:MAG TPA: lysophospholipid acyltransferase family protein, partial [Thermoanaerobaculia bacterium]